VGKGRGGGAYGVWSVDEGYGSVRGVVAQEVERDEHGVGGELRAGELRWGEVEKREGHT